MRHGNNGVSNYTLLSSSFLAYLLSSGTRLNNNADSLLKVTIG
jgi:hypothetical protein